MALLLPRLARSRRLRAMGLLAWLMLVINSVAAAPMGMAGVAQSHATHATTTVASEPCHHEVAAAASGSCCANQGCCCGGTAAHTCLCSTTMPPEVMVVLASVAITARYAMPLPRSAPSFHTAPPLRPPAA